MNSATNSDDDDDDLNDNILSFYERTTTAGTASNPLLLFGDASIERASSLLGLQLPRQNAGGIENVTYAMVGWEEVERLSRRIRIRVMGRRSRDQSKWLPLVLASPGNQMGLEQYILAATTAESSCPSSTDSNSDGNAVIAAAIQRSGRVGMAFAVPGEFRLGLVREFGGIDG